jgi:hypothetical protein
MSAMSKPKPNPLSFLITIGTMLSLAPVQQLAAADHREAPRISFEASGEILRCPEELHLPILLSVEVPGTVLRRHSIPVSFITRDAERQTEAMDYQVWLSDYGSEFSAVLNPGSQQSSETHFVFPAANNREYDVRFRFRSLDEGNSCALAAKMTFELEPAQVISVNIGGIE